MLKIQKTSICCPYYTQLNKNKLSEFFAFQEKLEIINVLIIHKNSEEDVIKAKNIFLTNEYKITTQMMSSKTIKQNIIKIILMNIDVNLRIIYKNYKNKQNLVVLY